MKSNIIDESEVLSWPKTKIEENINHVLKLVRNKLNFEEEEFLVYANFIVDSCLQYVHVNNLELEVYSHLCPVIEELFYNTINGLTGVKDLKELAQTQGNATDTCQHLLELCEELMKILFRMLDTLMQFPTVEIEFVYSLLNCSLKVVVTGMKFNLNSNQLQDGCANIQGAVKSLLDSSFKLLQSVMQCFLKRLHVDVTEDENLNTINALILTLSNIAVVSLHYDTKIMVETWKCVVMLVEKYKDCNLKLNCPGLVVPLCCKLKKDFNNVIAPTNDKMTESLRNIKILGFILKITIKAINLFVGFIGEECVKAAIDVLLLLSRFTPNFMASKGLSSDIISELHRQLIVGAEPLLTAVMTETHFPSFLVSALDLTDNNDSYGSLILLMTFLNKSMRNCEVRNVTANMEVNILHLIFKFLSDCNDGVLNGILNAPGTTTVGQPVAEADLYHYILTTTAIYVLSSPPSEFGDIEETLITNILQANPWKAMLASDLCCLIVRFAEPDVCHSIVRSIFSILEIIDLGSNRPEFCYLLSLLKRLIPSCDPSCVEELKKLYSNSQINVPLLAILQQNENNVLLKIEDLLRSFDDCDRSGVTFLIELTGSLQIQHVSNQEDTLSESELQLMENLWKFAPETAHSALMERYFRILCQFTCSFLCDLPDTVILTMLSQLENLSDKFRSTADLLAVLKVISAVRSINNWKYENEIINICSNLWQKILGNKSSIIGEIALQDFASYALVTKHPEIISNTVVTNDILKNDLTEFLQKKLPAAVAFKTTNSQFLHSCLKFEPVMVDDSVPHTKKRRVEIIELPVIEALETLKSSAALLLENVEVLSTEERNLIRSVINKRNVWEMLINQWDDAEAPSSLSDAA